ncbi:MAG: DNA-directed RNA polymerase, subunit E'' [Candidatus Diapherotrites archaeon]|nr:DNA-directed RNA polymerase, subunit E'' [Candidatus Diapherotrites archaeon]
MVKKEKACRTCKRLILEEAECPSCGNKKFSTLWKGLIIITDPENSAIAQKLEIKIPGRYALQIGR